MSWRKMAEEDLEKEWAKLSPEDREFALAEHELRKSADRGNVMVLALSAVFALITLAVGLLGSALEWWAWSKVFE